MSIAETLVPEFDHEMSVTRKLLQVLPQDKADWKPHEKSFALSKLALHIAEIPAWAETTMKETELDIAPASGSQYKPASFNTTAGLIELLDSNVKKGRAAISSAQDKDFFIDWALKKTGETIFSLPRIAVLRGFVIKHIVHHRAQLGMYYRLLDLAVPQTYGPTADFPAFGE